MIYGRTRRKEGHRTTDVYFRPVNGEKVSARTAHGIAANQMSTVNVAKGEGRQCDAAL